MRNKGKRGGGAVDSDDSQSQVMSPRLPQTPNVTDPTASGSVSVSGQHGSVPLVHSDHYDPNHRHPVSLDCASESIL